MHTPTIPDQKSEKSRAKGCKFAEIVTQQAYIEVARSVHKEVLTISPNTMAILPLLNVDLKKLRCSGSSKAVQLVADISVTNQTSITTGANADSRHRLLIDILRDGVSIVKGPQVFTNSLVGGSRTLNFSVLDELTSHIEKSSATATYQVILRNEYATPIQIKFFCLTAKVPISKKETFYVNQKFAPVDGASGVLELPADSKPKSIVILVPKSKFRRDKLPQVKLSAVFNADFDGASFPDITYEILRDAKSLTCGPQSVLVRTPSSVTVSNNKKIAASSVHNRNPVLQLLETELLINDIINDINPSLRPISELDDFIRDLEREGKKFVGGLSVTPTKPIVTPIIPPVNLTGVHNFAQNIVDDTSTDFGKDEKDFNDNVRYELQLVNRGSGTPAKLNFYSFLADVITPRKRSSTMGATCVNFSALQLFSDTKEGVKTLRPGNFETYSVPVKIGGESGSTTVKLTANLNAAFHFIANAVDKEKGKFYFEILRVPNCGDESKSVSVTKGRQLIFATPDGLVGVSPPTLGSPANFNCVFLGICPNGGGPRSGVVAASSLAPVENVLMIDLNSQVSVVDKVDVPGKYTYQILLTNGSNFDAVINNLVFVAEL